MSWPCLVLCKEIRPQGRFVQAGFGLVELMVSISVMLIVMSVILINQTSFNGAVLLRNQAYEIALATREIQLSAVSAMGDGSGNFRSVLGLYFETATTSYKIFKDAGNDYFYTNAAEELGIQGKINPRFEIEKILDADGNNVAGDKVSVVFERPNFDAIFFSSAGNKLNTSSIEIYITKYGSTCSTLPVTPCPGITRIVEITTSGQISVK